MSEHTPSTDQPADDRPSTVETPAAGAADAEATPAVAVPPVPPLPPQSAGAAAAPASYAAQAPYTAPAPGGHAQSDGAAPTAPFGTAPTAPYGTVQTAPHGSAPHPTAPHAVATSPAPAANTGKVGAGKIVGIMVAAALVGGAAGLGGAAAGASFFPTAQTVVTTGTGAVTVNNTDSVNQTTAIAAKVLPSVVTISASSGSSGGTGSGVILTSDGYVVTNTHVVTLDGETADASLSVTTSDGKVYQAEVVGTDPTYDLAVIKLKDASGLTPIEFGDSGDLNVGDQTVAIGAPLGLSNTVTTGIVSALNRSIQIASSAAPDGDTQQPEDNGQGQSPFQFDYGQGNTPSTGAGSISISVIQTDAAINPGNSGGALVDAEGKLIGINVAIATAGGSSSSESGSIGVGFSIPSSIVKRVTDELIADGAATHGLLGAMVGDAAAQDGATTSGAYISEVTAGGAAATAGLKAGDVVTSFNGFPVTDATDLTAQVRALAAGSSAKIVYLRDGKTLSSDVKLGTLTP